MPMSTFSASVCVFCGSRPGLRASYETAATETGEMLARLRLFELGLAGERGGEVGGEVGGRVGELLGARNNREAVGVHGARLELHLDHRIAELVDAFRAAGEHNEAFDFGICGRLGRLGR